MLLSTAAQGHGSTLSSPCPASRARGRASSMFSSRRPSRRLFFRPASPVRNPAADPRPFLNATCPSWSPAQLSPQQAVPSTLAPHVEGKCAPVDLRGPRAHPDDVSDLVQSSKPACAGRRRGFAPPHPASREQLPPQICISNAVRDPCTQQMTIKESGWTPLRPPAGLTDEMPSGALGPGLQETVWSMLRASSLSASHLRRGLPCLRATRQQHLWQTQFATVRYTSHH